MLISHCVEIGDIRETCIYHGHGLGTQQCVPTIPIWSAYGLNRHIWKKGRGNRGSEDRTNIREMLVMATNDWQQICGQIKP